MQVSTFGRQTAAASQFGYRDLTEHELFLVGGGDGEGDGGGGADGADGGVAVGDTATEGDVTVAGLADTVNAIGQGIASIAAVAAVVVATDGMAAVIGIGVAIGTALGAITSPGMGGAGTGNEAPAPDGNPMGDPTGQSLGDTGP